MMKKAVICIISILALTGITFARTTFDEFQATRSPEIVRQATKLARWSVECRLRGEDANKPPIKLHPIFKRRSGIFVTILKNGKPRGCMGTIEPVQPDITKEIIVNAAKAAASDLRQKPLQPHELSKVTFCVAVIGPLKPVRGIGDLAPDKLGLLVRSGSQSGILLPGEAKTASWQIKECKRKAGLKENTPVRMYVFRTVALEEKR